MLSELISREVRLVANQLFGKYRQKDVRETVCERKRFVRKAPVDGSGDWFKLNPIVCRRSSEFESFKSARMRQKEDGTN